MKLLSQIVKLVPVVMVAFSTHLLACNAGCPANAGPAPTSCPANPPSYVNDVAPIISQECLSCHSENGEESSIPLETYDEVFNERTIAQDQIESCAMPQSGSLSDSQRTTLLTWFACGAPN